MTAPTPRIALVVVPFITADLHRSLAEMSLRSLGNVPLMDTIAIVNRLRPQSDDEAWLRRSFSYVEMNDANILARAWNKGIRKAIERGAEYVLLLNLDLVLHSLCISNLVSFAQRHPEALLWSGSPWDDVRTLEEAPLTEEISEHPHCSCFMVDARLFSSVGEFDEQFVPAYHEDSDMLYRIKLSGAKALRTTQARFFHLERGTIKGIVLTTTPQEVKKLDAMIDDNLQRYTKKWGGSPTQETFTSPYNRDE